MRLTALVPAILVGVVAFAAAAAEPTPAPNAPPYPKAAAPSPPPFPAVPGKDHPGAPPAAAALVPARSRPDPSKPPRGRTCYSQTEAREKIAQHRLSDPVSAMEAGRSQGEALRAKLCRWKADEFVYEVFVLRRDGHIVRLYMNAQNGQAVGVLDQPEHR